MLSKNSTVIATANQVSTSLAGEVTILNLDNGTYYSLDDVGATIWVLLNQPVSIPDLVHAITERYEVDAAQAEQDLLELLQRLEKEGLVQIAP